MFCKNVNAILIPVKKNYSTQFKARFAFNVINIKKVEKIWSKEINNIWETYKMSYDCISENCSIFYLYLHFHLSLFFIYYIQSYKVVYLPLILVIK